jgi:hypothetical protein
MRVQRYQVRHRAPWMDHADEVHVPASHLDQVVVCPPGDCVTVDNSFTTYAGLNYGDAISFQFHPEFTPGFGKALVELRRSKYGAGADAAAASYQGSGDCARIGGWINRFLDGPGLRPGDGTAWSSAKDDPPGPTPAWVAAPLCLQPDVGRDSIAIGHRSAASSARSRKFSASATLRRSCRPCTALATSAASNFCGICCGQFMSHASTVNKMTCSGRAG